MNKYAQIRGGKIIYLYETTMSIEELSNVFSPETFWVDVTGVKCGLGWEASFNEECKLVLRPPAPPEPPKPPTEAEIKADIQRRLLAEVDALLDETVATRGYDSILHCVSYEGDSDPIFQQEGKKAKEWRSKVYRQCYDILEQVESGKRGIPTKEELLAELPRMEW